MRLSLLSLLLLPLLAASQSPPSPATTATSIALPTTPPLQPPIDPALELRQLDVGAVPTSAIPATQVSPVTTIWVQTVIDGKSTAVQVAYTQTFASVPVQGSGPLDGSVGLGTLTGTVGAVRTDEADSGVGRVAVGGALVGVVILTGGLLTG